MQALSRLPPTVYDRFWTEVFLCCCVPWPRTPRWSTRGWPTVWWPLTRQRAPSRTRDAGSTGRDDSSRRRPAGSANDGASVWTLSRIANFCVGLPGRWRSLPILTPLAGNAKRTWSEVPWSRNVARNTKKIQMRPWHVRFLGKNILTEHASVARIFLAKVPPNASFRRSLHRVHLDLGLGSGRAIPKQEAVLAFPIGAYVYNHPKCRHAKLFERLFRRLDIQLQVHVQWRSLAPRQLVEWPCLLRVILFYFLVPLLACWYGLRMDKKKRERKKNAFEHFFDILRIQLKVLHK